MSGTAVMEPKQCVALWIRTIRKRQGLTQAELAERIGRLPNAVSELERGRSQPVFETLRRLSGALDVPMRDFFAPVEEASSAKHDALLRNLLDIARTLPLADLEMTVNIVGAVAKRCAERAG